MSICLFYSKNQFILINEDFFSGTSVALHKCELYLFLESLPEVARQYLRYVTWLLKPVREYIILGELSYQNWINCIDLLGQNFDLTMLSLTLDFSLLRIYIILNGDVEGLMWDGITYAEMEKLEHDSVQLVRLFFIL
jgi:hypothetical protein